ncbi:hypothetical protein [Methanobrevibacter sp.]
MKNSINDTVVLNKSNSDGFIDFNSSYDLDEVMKSLNKLMGGDVKDILYDE